MTTKEHAKKAAAVSTAQRVTMAEELAKEGYITAKEAAVRARVAVSTIYYWITEGVLTGRLVGRKRVFIAVKQLEPLCPAASAPDVPKRKKAG